MALMGTSGSGKSTLLQIIGCLDLPSSGNYWFNEQAVISLKEKELAQIRNQKIGFVFQSFHLLPRMSALRNVELPSYYIGSSNKKRYYKMLFVLGYTKS